VAACKKRRGVGTTRQNAALCSLPGLHFLEGLSDFQAEGSLRQ
jgi:hypothetical protein